MLIAKSQLIFKKYTVIFVGVRGVLGVDPLLFPGYSYFGVEEGLFLRFRLVAEIGSATVLGNRGDWANLFAW